MLIPSALTELLRDSSHVCVLTGSGISAESGVPTFRDAQTGLWEQFNPLELATPDAFLRDPELVWRWYRWRRELVAVAKPNPAHFALAKLAGLLPRVTLITQNVDGLHQQAGSRDVIEFHGNLFSDRCFVEGIPVDDANHSEAVPHCSGCGAHLRPGVVWFGEAIPERALTAASLAVADCDLFLSIGTSSTVWPAAGFAESAAAAGATVVEVNPDATEITASVDYCLEGKAGSVLPDLINSLAPDE